MWKMGHPVDMFCRQLGNHGTEPLWEDGLEIHVWNSGRSNCKNNEKEWGFFFFGNIILVEC